jgi:hypothetical protein
VPADLRIERVALNTAVGGLLIGARPTSRAELLRALTLPDFERADAIGSYWATQAYVWSEARTQCLRLTEAILSE